MFRRTENLQCATQLLDLATKLSASISVPALSYAAPMALMDMGGFTRTTSAIESRHRGSKALRTWVRWLTTMTLTIESSSYQLQSTLNHHDEVLFDSRRGPTLVFRRGHSFPHRIASAILNDPPPRRSSLGSHRMVGSTSQSAFLLYRRIGRPHGRTTRSLISPSRSCHSISPQKRSRKPSCGHWWRSPTVHSGTQTSLLSRSSRIRPMFSSSSMVPLSPSRTWPCNYLETSSNSS